MKFLVMWFPDNEVEISFFRTKEEAVGFIGKLIFANEQTIHDNEGELESWDITLLKVVGEVVPEAGNLKLVEKD